jgi:hypothetical protein
MIEIYDADRLAEQLIYRIGPGSDRKIAFVVGSGLTRPSIPDVAEYIHAMRASLDDTTRVGGLVKAFEAFDMAVDDHLSSVKYQRAASFIQGSRGHERLNEIIRIGVLRACQRDVLGELTREEARRLVMNEVALEDLETSAAWKLPEGVKAFGRVLTGIKAAGKSGPVITTNFDPLIELSVQQAGGQCDVQCMDSTDGRIPPSLQHSAINVIHVHGYWRQGETLHTQYQLSRTRTRLASSLERRLQGNYVVVVGYGGWRDVFTKCLMGFLSKGDCLDMALSWGWHGELEQRDFRAGVKAQLARLSCVSHYREIDANVLFPDVLKRL